MNHEKSPFDDPELVRLLASPGPLRLEPTRWRWALGLALHLAIIALCVLAWRGGYFASLMAQLSAGVIVLFLPVTMAHAVGWRCFVEVDHSGIRQVLVGWTRTYAWADVSNFSLRVVNRKTLVVFQEAKGGKARERSIGFTYGMDPQLFVRFLRVKQALLHAASSGARGAA